MVRTQIYLTEEQTARLRRMAARTGQSQSELIRAAIDRIEESAESRVALLRQARGLWENQPPSLHEDFRREAEDRLKRLYEEREAAA